MTYFNRKDYSGAINQEELRDFLNNSGENMDAVQKIQYIKEDVVSKIFNIGKLDSNGFKNSEELYLLALEELESIDIANKDNYISVLKKEIENMSKKQTFDFLENKNKEAYIGDFESFKELLNKFIYSNKSSLKNSLSDRFVNNKDKEEIKKYLKATNNESIENTRKRNFFFDEKIFEHSLGNNMSSKNIECFYEEDFSGNKNYFSINTLTNYIDTFGVEIGLAEIDMDSIPNDIRKKYFPSINRRIKSSMYKNILQDLRDKQEVLMYGFKDYELIEGINKDQKSGFIAEKLVELEFRELSQLSEYNISIIRGSIGEDQQDKIDLYIVLEDKKTGIKIQDELQITLREDIELKEEQIEKRNKILQSKGEYSESQLIQFTLKDLGKKVHAWKYFNRPIGRLGDTFDEIEKTTIRETFKRLVGDLEEKINKKQNKNPL